MELRSKFQLGAIAVVLTLLASLVSISPAPAGTATILTTCLNLETEKERISRTGKCPKTQALSKWRLVTTDSEMRTGSATKTLTVCSNKADSLFNYQIIKPYCSKLQKRVLYARSGSLPEKPTITRVLSESDNSASLTLASDPAENLDSPIAYYTVISSKGETKRIYAWKELTITLTGLRPSTSYSFTITATNADGTSPLSSSSVPVTTLAYIPPVISTSNTTPISAPAFTISSTSEVKFVNSPITGYTITSTGGAITSYSISPSAPAGLAFNTSTGLLSGTPTVIRNTTLYTITARNAGGTAIRTFNLKVVGRDYSLGDIGPGGGNIFYESAEGFLCGPLLEARCNYLEAAPTIFGSSGLRWATDSNRYSTVNNLTAPETAASTEIGTGYRNTRAIILQGNSDSSTSAAAYADTYKVVTSAGTIDDWYLPARDELKQLFSARASLGFSIVTTYWSSSEASANSAWYQGFYGDPAVDEGNAQKDVNLYVRAIRAFATRTTPVFTLSSTSETLTARTTAISGYTINSTGGTVTSYSISPSLPAGLDFNLTTGLISGTPSETSTATTYTITGTNSFGSATAKFGLRVTGDVGDIGPGGGIIFYVSASTFTSTGSTCNTTCKYLEVAPATWQSAGVSVANDSTYQWSSNKTDATEQNTSTVGTESGFDQEKFNWKIGQGFYNTSVMKVTSATSSAQAAVLAYAGNSTAGQWFIPSANELNELCKYARGQLTGNVTVACNSSGNLKTGTLNELGGFVSNLYMSSSEWWNYGARSQYFSSGSQRSGEKDLLIYVRPIRAF